MDLNTLMSKSMDLETLPVLIEPLSPPSSSSPPPVLNLEDQLQLQLLAVNFDTLMSKPPPPLPPVVQAASVRPRNMTPVAYKELNNKINRRSCEKKMLEREDDKERIRSLEKSLRLEKKKSRALEIKVQELEGKLEGKL